MAVTAGEVCEMADHHLVSTYLRKPFVAKDMPCLPKELKPVVKELHSIKESQ